MRHALGHAVDRNYGIEINRGHNAIHSRVIHITGRIVVSSAPNGNRSILKQVIAVGGVSQ